MSQRILFISNAPVRGWISALEEEGFEVICAEPFATIDRIPEAGADLIVLDIADVAAGIHMLNSIRSANNGRSPAVLVLAEWGTGQATLALTNGAAAFEPKPLAAARLVTAVEKLLRPQRTMIARANDAEAR